MHCRIDIKSLSLGIMMICTCCSNMSSYPASTSTIQALPTQRINTDLSTEQPTIQPTATIDIIQNKQCASEFTSINHEETSATLTAYALLDNLSLPTETLPEKLLNHQIGGDGTSGYAFTHYRMLDNGCTFWIINEYYDDNMRLWLLKLEKSTGQWNFQEIEGASNFMGMSRGINHYFIQRHINPSAGDFIVLSNNLEEFQIVPGYLHNSFKDDLIVFTPNSIHFAPTHPTEIALYDPSTKKTTTLLPTTPDPTLWLAFEDELEKVYSKLREDGWCQRNNHYCDPKYFTRYFYNVTVNNKTDSLAFIAEFVGDGFYAGPYELSDGTVLTIENQNVVYIFRNVHELDKLEYKELKWDDVGRYVDKDEVLSNLLEGEVLEIIFSVH